MKATGTGPVKVWEIPAGTQVLMGHDVTGCAAEAACSDCGWYAPRMNAERAEVAAQEHRSLVASMLPVGTVVTYAGSRVDDHGLYTVKGHTHDGRYEISDVFYPWYILTQVPRQSLTPTSVSR